jgi:hypothetical protein
VHIDANDQLRGAAWARPGLPSILLGLLIVGLILATVFFLLAGLVLVVVPVAVAAIAIALLSGTVRYRWRRLQAWWAGQ